MKKSAILGALAVLLTAHLVSSAPVDSFDDKLGFRQYEIEPFSGRSISLRCRANERTSVMIYGFGRSPMGIYVFDKHDNCVARDDEAPNAMTDDLAVEWHPPVEDNYDVEVRNLGRKLNTAEVAIR